MSLFLSVLEQGLIYAVLALGVYITFKILDFPDMSVDSSFPLGAAVTALMIQAGAPPLLTLPVSLLAGALAGALTGVIHVKFKVRDLLSGIIVMTALYSVNLHIAGRANVQLFSFNTIFKNPTFNALPFSVQTYIPAMILAAVGALVVLTAGGSALSLVGIIYGVIQLFSVVPVGLYEIGMGVIIAGGIMFVGILIYNVAVRLLPFLMRMVWRLFCFVLKKLRVLFNFLRRECAKL